MSRRQTYGPLWGINALASLDAAGVLVRQFRQLGGAESLLRASAAQRLLGRDVLRCEIERAAFPSAALHALSAAVIGPTLDAVTAGSYAGVTESFHPLGSSALSLFDRPGWRTAVARHEVLGDALLASRATLAVAQLGANVDSVAILAKRLGGDAGIAAPIGLLGLLDASYRGWAATLDALPRHPHFPAVWRSLAIGEVPLRLTACAVALADPDGPLDDWGLDEEPPDDEPLKRAEAGAFSEPFDVDLRAQLDARLGMLHPTLPSRLQEAKRALLRDDPRSPGQAAHELVELIKHAVHAAATEADVRQWHLSRPDHDSSRTLPVTLGLRLRYLATLSPAAAVAEAQVEPLLKTLRFLQDCKHSLDISPAQPIRLVVPAVEAALALLLAVEPRD